MTMPSPGARGLTSRSSRGTRAEHHRPSRADARRFLLCLVLGCVACAPAGEQPRRAPSPPLDTTACDDACVRQRQREVLAALDDGEVDRARTLHAALPPPEDATGDPWAHLVEARIRLAEGDRATALQHATLVADASTSPRAAIEGARLLVRLGAPAQASGAMRRLTDSISAPAAAFEVLAEAWTAQGQPEAAARALERGLARTGDRAALLERLAGIRAAQGRQREAIDLYARALPDSSDPAAVHRGIARLASALRDHPLALSHAESAVRLGGPAAPESYRVLAEVHAAAGDTQQAAAVLEQGRRRFPGDQGWTR